MFELLVILYIIKLYAQINIYINTYEKTKSEDNKMYRKKKEKELKMTYREYLTEYDQRKEKGTRPKMLKSCKS